MFYISYMYPYIHSYIHTCVHTYVEILDLRNPGDRMAPGQRLRRGAATGSSAFF